jgi:hypothetical protein
LPPFSPGAQLDRQRTARLILDGADPKQRVAAGLGRVHGLPALLAIRYGRRDHLSLAVEPAVALRRAALGPAAAGPPRVLLRVDEFPDARARADPGRSGTDAYARFHDVLAGAGVPYLVAALPRVADDHLTPGADDGDELDPGEVAMFRRLAGEDVAFGLHAHTHRTRFAHHRRRSAISGLSPSELDVALNGAEARLAAVGIRARVFVPPFNRFDARQYPILARRYDVICGGPESVRAMGLQQSPRWIGDAVYLPSYAPFYARAAAIVPAIEALAEANAAVWLPVTIHPGWELGDELCGLKKLARTIAPLARPWADFLDAVDRSR